ncbi:MAG: twin-arginine translocase TatA/TatE family subunit [Coriobacteriaceae bacterium]|nr:twin-arginine translocase TatA/TatE family subunit [Coriobacteriaceae bacterium]
MHILGMGTPELIIILVVALLIFGPKNLPKLGQAIGRSVKGLRDGMEGTESDDADDLSMSRVDRAAKRLAEDQAREKAEKAATAQAKA